MSASFVVSLLLSFFTPCTRYVLCFFFRSLRLPPTYQENFHRRMMTVLLEPCCPLLEYSSSYPWDAWDGSFGYAPLFC